MRYILGIFGFIILAIVAVVLISTTTDNRSTKQTGDPQVDVSSFADKTATFSLTSQGEITGEDTFQSVLINVTPTERKIQILIGYNGVVQSERTFANSQAAYNVFVNALDNAGYSRERDSNPDEKFIGSCPLGNRYLYEITENGNDALSLWSTSCGRRSGTFGGDSPTVRTIFENQIPNYDDIIEDVNL